MPASTMRRIVGARSSPPSIFTASKQPFCINLPAAFTAFFSDTLAAKNGMSPTRCARASPRATARPW